MASWMEAVCLKCGAQMKTSPCLVDTEPESWLDAYPEAARRGVMALGASPSLPLKYHHSTCETCGTELVAGVQNPYAETKDGRIAVMVGGQYLLVSDEAVLPGELDA